MAFSIRRTATLAAAVLGLVLTLQGPASPASPPSTPPNQLVGVIMAEGIKSGGLFGGGEVTPVGLTTSFVNTDLPYAVVRVKTLVSNTTVTLRVTGPAGPAFTIEAKAPRHKNDVWQSFDFALPLYILGTDLENETGTWTLEVLFNGQSATAASFTWQAASPIVLAKIKDLVDRSPTDADLHWRYGAALALLHHDQEAIPELQSAMQLDRNYALYYITLGRVYEREGRPQDAIRSFQTALSIHGSAYDAVYSGWAREHLARLHAR